MVQLYKYYDEDVLILTLQLGEAWDEAGQIGVGKHERFIIDIESFLVKAQNRKQRI